MKKSIWGNCIVKNEDKYIWFAIMSVIDILDKLIIWDTGSTDQTVEIVKFIQLKYPEKIIFREYGKVNEVDFTKARQEMLQETKSDWLFLLDGDEVWWRDSLEKIIKIINERESLACLVTPCYNLVGDIYHYQEESAGQYKILGKKGHYNVRVINKNIPGLHVDLPYGKEGFFDVHNSRIQDLGKDKVLFVDAPYMHTTHLQRSSKINSENEVMQRSSKRKFEIGNKFPKGFKYPEVFYDKFPDIVASPWSEMSFDVKFKSVIQTPFKKIKRKILK